MRYSKGISILMISLILLSPCLSQICAASEDITGEDYPRLIDKFLVWFYKRSYEGPILSMIFSPMGLGSGWKGFRFATPRIFGVSPSSVDLRYLNSTEITVGIPDNEGGWRKDIVTQPIFQVQYFQFSLEIPEEIPSDVFSYRFYPSNKLFPEKGKEMKIRLIIDTHIPRNVTLPEDLTLVINATQYQIFDNLFLRGGKFDLMWFIAAIGLTGNPFGFKYSGKTEIRTQKVEFLVRNRRFHLAEITPVETINMKPDKVRSIPVKVKNLGSHVDSFNFKVTTNSGSDLVVSPPQPITLGPNEESYTTLGVASSRNFQDPGTLHNIKIQAYSIYDEAEDRKYFTNSLTVITRGIYLSEIGIIYSSFIILVLSLFVVFLMYRRKRILDKICKKPDKPWEITEEKKYLEKLRQKDREKYDQVLKMMKDEYNSALLWYKNYCRVILIRTGRKKKPSAVIMDTLNSLTNMVTKFVNIFKTPIKERKRRKKVEENSVEKKKPKREKKEKPAEMKTEETEKKEKEEKRKLTDRIAEMKKRKKIEAIQKAKRKQEKQKRKFLKSTY